MHEMSIAMNLIEVACERAQEEGATRINEIEVEIGALAGVMIHSLEFCFDSARKETLAAEASLRIIPVSGKALCLDCQKEFPADSFFALCPTCGGYRVEITQGKSLKIKSVEID